MENASGLFHLNMLQGTIFTGAGRELSELILRITKQMLGSVPQHHPDAIPSIDRLQFAQST
jgi:hypothetical protein